MLKTELNSLSLCLNEQNGAFDIRFSSGRGFSQRGIEGIEVSNVRKNGDALEYDAKISDAEFRVSACIISENEVQIRIGGGELHSNLVFPGAFKVTSENEVIIPMADGIIFPADEVYDEATMQRFFASAPMSGGTTRSMGCWGILGKAASVLVGVENSCDARLNCVYEDSLFHCRSEWMPSKNEFGYDRVLRIFITDSDDMPYLCSLYRKWREELGMVRTLANKAKTVPNVEKLMGAADMWVFDDNTTNRLYGRAENEDGIEINTATVAKELKSLGIDRMLINSFETQDAERVQAIKDLGYLTGRYDIYRDMIPGDVAHLMLPFRLKQKEKHIKCWPDEIVVNADGSLKKAWALHGTDGKMYDQNAVCDICAIELTKTEVKEYKETYGYNSWFIDVQVASQLGECYHPKHPMTRSQSRDAIRVQNEFVLNELGLVNGVEAGQEMFVSGYCFAEGIMSPCMTQAPDAGRNMDTLYYGDNIPETMLARHLNPKYRYPLWELIYHDCAVSYWYWGDSSNNCPELIKIKDTFNALYGTPPLYTASMSQFKVLKELIAESYKRATPVARQTATSRMIDFVRLTEDSRVQQSRFENGLTVIANFSDEPYTADNGRVVEPQSAVWF